MDLVKIRQSGFNIQPTGAKGEYIVYMAPPGKMYKIFQATTLQTALKIAGQFVQDCALQTTNKTNERTR